MYVLNPKFQAHHYVSAMKGSKAQPFSSFAEILTRSQTLQEYVKKAENLAQLNKFVLNKLDPIIAAHSQVISLNDNILTISCSSSAFGHKLRFFGPDFLSLLRQNPKWSALKAIEIKVRPNTDTEAIKPPVGPKPYLSPKSAEVIHASAEEINSEKLRASLLKLSTKANKVSN